eukprot:3297622-Amphidinium_carterae.1
MCVTTCVCSPRRWVLIAPLPFGAKTSGADSFRGILPVFSLALGFLPSCVFEATHFKFGVPEVSKGRAEASKYTVQAAFPTFGDPMLELHVFSFKSAIDTKYFQVLRTVEGAVITAVIK